jgi:DNA-binding HxlR family transcriptional regulator
MATRRSYADACPIARALDVVGERWALLVVRELLLGPQRFSDLRRALPGASTNMLTDRLRELADHGVVSRRRLPPPAASVVYELTERGRELTPTLEALGAWGAALPRPSGQPSLSATSVLLFLCGCLRAHPNPPDDVYRVQLDDRVWTIRTAAGQLEVEPGEPSSPDARLRTDPDTLNALLDDPNSLDAAIASATVDTSGDLSCLRRLLRVAHEGARSSPH